MLNADPLETPVASRRFVARVNLLNKFSIVFSQRYFYTGPAMRAETLAKNLRASEAAREC